MNPELENQTIKQKKILFAQNTDAVEGAIAILRECSRKGKLVGDSEYDTIVNAVSMDAQAQLLIDFLTSIDSIKRGGLLTTES